MNVAALGAKGKILERFKQPMTGWARSAGKNSGGRRRPGTDG
jgi:hypothetical protein